MNQLNQRFSKQLEPVLSKHHPPTAAALSNPLNPKGRETCLIPSSCSWPVLENWDQLHSLLSPVLAVLPGPSKPTKNRQVTANGHLTTADP